jgi:hypothetical protein
VFPRNPGAESRYFSVLSFPYNVHFHTWLKIVSPGRWCEMQWVPFSLPPSPTQGQDIPRHSYTSSSTRPLWLAGLESWIYAHTCSLYPHIPPQTFVTSELHRGVWSVSCYGRFTPRGGPQGAGHKAMLVSQGCSGHEVMSEMSRYTPVRLIRIFANDIDMFSVSPKTNGYSFYYNLIS